MSDHVQDEARHANFFSKLLEFYWYKLDDSSKNMLGPCIIDLVIGYFDENLEKGFSKCMLQNLDCFNDKQINQIIDDTFEKNTKETLEANIIYKQIINLLTRAKILDHTLTKDHLINRLLVE